MAEDLSINLVKQYRKLSYPLYVCIRKFNPSTPKYYVKNSKYSILVNGTKMQEARLVAANVLPMKDLSNEVTMLDCDLRKEEFINKFSQRYSVDELMIVLILAKI